VVGYRLSYKYREISLDQQVDKLKNNQQKAVPLKDKKYQYLDFQTLKEHSHEKVFEIIPLKDRLCPN
jgi:hypothetical protein